MTPPSHTNDIPPTHIDIGGMALPREELARVLPDIERFERHLPDALAIDTEMKQGDGSIPARVRDWPQEHIVGVVATLKELGSLREQAGESLQQPTRKDNGGDAS